MKTNTAAIVTIHNAPNMHKRGRAKIANWLRQQAATLEQNHRQLSKRYTARWLYT